MAEKQLNAAVVLMGRVDNSVGKIGQALTNIGSYIDQASQKLINFGKESVNVYRDYQDSMLDAEVALSTTYGRGTKELRSVMKQLDTAASQWAASTIFHTDDVANAISEAAHANWDLDKIMEGMPAAMKLAQAGGLDLSTGLDYIIKSANAAGIAFEDMGTWIDEWVYAANSSAGTVDQFGEAMLKMGSTMKFAGNKEELLTMLAVLHDAGTTGSAAGTLLRNAMIRLINPTKAAADAMSGLGFTEDEIEGAMTDADGTLTEVNAQLKELGFSAYDNKGNLKDFATIFSDLYAVTKNMSQQNRNKIWGTIFPTRTITGAIALLEAADNNWNGLLDSLNGGKASGYGDYASETMMSGLTGSIEVFNSKVEELKRVVGENLAPQLKTVADNFGKVVDLFAKAGTDNGVGSGLSTIEKISGIVGDLATNIGNLDPALFDALVGGLGEIATLGPTMLLAGGALKGISWAMSLFTGSTIGKLFLVAAAVSVVASALKSYNEAKYLENFGDLKIDTATLDANLKSISDAFENNKAPIEAFAKALDDSVKNYETASQTFSATMMEDLLKDQTLTGAALDEKLAEYRNLGEKMVESLQDGIKANADMSAEFWLEIFKGKNGNEADLKGNKALSAIAVALEDASADAVAKANEIGTRLNNAITSAWADGHLSEEEREQIRNLFREMNEAFAEAEAEAQKEADFVKRAKMMDKMQGMSYQQMMEYMTGTLNPARQAELDWWGDIYLDKKNSLVYQRNKYEEQYRQALAQGDSGEAEVIWGKMMGLNAGIAEAQEAWNAYRSEIYGNYDDMILTWFGATGSDSDLGVDALRTAAGMLLSGQTTDLAALQDYAMRQGANVGAAGRFYREMIDLLGGMEEVQDRATFYEQNGNTEMARKMREILAIYDIVSGNNQTTGTEYEGHDTELSARELEDLYKQGYFAGDIEAFLNLLTNPDLDENTLLTEMSAMYSGEGDKAWYLKEMIDAFGAMYDLDKLGGRFENDDLRKSYGLLSLLGMNEEQRQQYLLGGEQNNPETAAQEAYDAASETLDKPMEVPLDMDGTAPAQTARTEAESVFSSPIQATLSFLRVGGGSGGGNTLEEQAYGGRATGPSLIAERGVPEWYIPEEHTPNTAKLIAAAARNSGFDLTELVEYGGGRAYADGGTSGDGSLWSDLNENGGAGSGSSGDTFEIEYSPVIHADNADGVGRALQQDKERLRKMLEKLLEEKEMYESMVSYA